jgi:hypothetical protein
VPVVQVLVQGPARLVPEQAARLLALSQRPGHADCTSSGSLVLVEQGQPLVEEVRLLVEVVWPPVEQGHQPPQARERRIVGLSGTSSRTT